MDYEKKYKEAFERAKIWQKHLYEVGDKDYGDELNYIFPELKESEGEGIRNRILLSLEKDLMATKNSGCNTQDLEQCIAWLEKQGEQKHAWSEEDEKMLNSIIEDFGDGKTSNMLQEYWLKSLRPQNTWKPSEEQMHALHDLNLTGNISYVGQGQVLVELYNDLKKLKGE